MSNALGGLAFLDDTGKLPTTSMPAGSGVTMGQVYPVGAVYLSMVATNPATLLGVGTWLQISSGQFLIGQGSAPFDVAGNTGGSSTATPTGTVAAPAFTGTSAIATSAVSAGTPAGTNNAPVFTGSGVTSGATSAGTPAGTNSAPTFSGSALSNHSHELPFIKVAGATGQLAMVASSIFGTGTSRAPESISAAPTSNTTPAAVELSQAVSAGTPAGTVTAPTFTGSALATHTHTVTAAGTVAAPTFTGSALATHTHTLTPTGTNSAPAFTGSSGSILNPYFVVYMWKRTA